MPCGCNKKKADFANKLAAQQPIAPVQPLTRAQRIAIRNERIKRRQARMNRRIARAKQIEQIKPQENPPNIPPIPPTIT